jgi:sterol desaturase/sphingolipid hydroxylase (fatty acid hydroxylase superfamily)
LHRVPREDGFNLPGNVTHLRHHADPNALDRLNVQLSESVPVCVVYLLIAWAATGSWQSAVYLFTGLIAGYFFYEYLDYQAHHGSARGRVVRYFRRYHLMHHHYDATVRYGVTSPLFDYIFGTYHVEKKRARVGGASHEGARA